MREPGQKSGGDHNPPTLDKVGGQSEDPRGGTPERLTGLASRRDTVSYGTPTEWSKAETGAKTLVNTCGAVERPKHSALNR